MKNNKLGLALSICLFSVATQATVIMEGAYVKTAVSNDGTLGAGGAVSPGILHDTTGTGTFGVNDYLTPGNPFEGFTVKTNETGSLVNNNSNSYTDGLIGSVTDISASSAYDHAVNFTASHLSYFDISTDTFFNNSDERISFRTTITANSDLSGVQFSRWLDPDPDVVSYGSYSTINGRGDVGLGLAASDWVHSEGSSTGLTIGLYSDSNVAHNTGVISNWYDGTLVANPLIFINGTDNGNGDNAIGVGFDIGSLLAGQSSTFTYSYIMGASLATVSIPSAVPEPSILALMGLGIFGLGLSRRKMK